MASFSTRNRNAGVFDENGKKKKPNWEYRFDIAGIDGKRKQKSKSGFKTKGEAERAASEALAEYNRAGQVFEPSEISLSDYLDYWIENYCKLNIADSTMSAYKNIIRKHIKPRIGHYRLRSITTDILQEFINKIYTDYGFSKSYMKNIRKVLNGSLKYAKVTAKFIQENPASDVSLPRIDEKKNADGEFQEEVIVLTNEQVNTILTRFENSPYQYFAMLTAYYTGMRVGEVYGLTWDCIDFENKRITVKQAVKKIEREGSTSDGKRIRGIRGKATTRWYLGEPKTPTSYRTIDIGDTLIDALKKYKAWQLENELKYGEYYVKHFVKDEITQTNRKVKRIISLPELDYTVPMAEIKPVFVKENGEFHGSDSAKYVSKVVNYELGIRYNFHAFRHTHATKLIEASVPVKTVSKRLGHSSIRTTLDIYTHVTNVMQQLAVDAFEKSGDLNNTKIVSIFDKKRMA